MNRKRALVYFLIITSTISMFVLKHVSNMKKDVSFVESLFSQTLSSYSELDAQPSDGESDDTKQELDRQQSNGASGVTKQELDAQPSDGESDDTKQAKEAKTSLPFWQKPLCDSRNVSIENIPPKAFRLEPNHGDEMPKVNSSNIFLIESSCDPRPTYRSWCAAESWASKNPNSIVQFVLTSPYVHDPTGLVSKLLNTYSNFKVPAIDVSVVFKGTPLRGFFESMRWANESDWPMIQLSDSLRVALVWTYGGFYSDTDLICIKSIEELRNVVGFQNPHEINNAHFHSEPKHPYFFKIMEEMNKNYNPKKWGSLGPLLYTKITKDLCGTNLRARGIDNPQECYNMTLLPPARLAPDFGGDHKILMKAGEWNRAEKNFNNTHSIHFYNSFLKRYGIVVGSGSIYEVASKKFCPVTYRYATAHSRFF